MPKIRQSRGTSSLLCGRFWSDVCRHVEEEMFTSTLRVLRGGVRVYFRREGDEGVCRLPTVFLTVRGTSVNCSYLFLGSPLLHMIFSLKCRVKRLDTDRMVLTGTKPREPRDDLLFYPSGTDFWFFLPFFYRHSLFSCVF